MNAARERHGVEQGMLLEDLREQVVQVGLEALARGIVHGTAGNMSIRDPETGLIAISPSGIPYPTVTPADVVIVDDRGEVVDGSRKPSSETPLHTMVMRARPDIGAIVHTHSHYSTVVSCIRPYLPPILTESLPGGRAAGAGDAVRADRDARFRRERAGGPRPRTREAVILKNHGLICFAESFDAALGIAEIVEEVGQGLRPRAGRQWWPRARPGARGLDSGDDRAVPGHVWTTEIVVGDDTNEHD